MNVDPNGHFGTPISWALAVIAGIAGGFFGNYLANELNLSGWERWLFIGAVAVGGAAIGFFAGEVLAGFATTFLLSNQAIMMSLPSSVLWFLGINGSRLAVLGSADYGVGYVNMAQHIGASFFRIADEIWYSMTATQRWVSNEAFLDNMISQGKSFLLTNNAWDTLKNFPNSNFGREIAYLLDKGYKIVENGFKMIK